tara:strand:+ start:861 stop:1481 length:621 start_codon:yes stop_codon:yes gene_type:complete
VKNLFIFFICFLFSVDIFSQVLPKQFKNDRFKELVSNHSQIAILPLNVSIIQKENKRRSLDENQLKNQQVSISLSFITNLYKNILSSKGRKLKIKIQNPNESLRILESKSFDLSNLDKYKSSEICDALGVNAVLRGLLVNQRTRSNALGSVSVMGLSLENKNSFEINIFDSSNRLLWKLEKSLSSNNLNEIIFRFIDLTTSKFPYK